jgi:phosphoglucosamine mutase
MKLFGTDGIRGRAGEFLTPQMALKIGMATGIYLKNNSITKKVLVGKDTRRSGYMIENSIVAGLTSVGYNVVQIGPMPTPAVSFLTANMRCDGGIMISASHNPYDDNGIKLFDSNGNKLDATAEAKIEEIYNTDISSSLKIGEDIGSSKRIDDVIGRYIVMLKSSFPRHIELSNYKVVLDVANGAGYKVAPTVFEELGADVVLINSKPDGYNINRLCGAMDTKSLSNTVKSESADIGFALDGDADRLVVIDENGDEIDGDNLIGSLSCYLKENNKLQNNKIVATIMSNLALEDFLSSEKIELLRCDVGDKNLIKVSAEENISFGGEQSGHILFTDYSKTGDGILSALQVMALLKSSNKTASKALRRFKLYPQISRAISVKDKIPLEQLDGYKKLLEELDSKNIRHIIRYSGTEQKLRITLESKDNSLIEKEIETTISFFKQSLTVTGN